MHRFLLAAAILLGLAASAGAQVAPTGFYIRGDAGGAFGDNVTFTDANPSAPNCDLCGARLPATVNTSFIGGGGVGYRFSPMLRIDLTLDDIPSFSASGTSTQPGNPSGSGDFSSLVAMANGYIDLNGLYPGWFGSLQPYLTGGVGLARNDAGAFSGRFTSGPLAGIALSEAGNVRTNFAWGVGAGVGFPILPSLTLDLQYKYLNLGELRTGTVVTVLGTATTVTASKSTDLDVHTLTVDLRYGF